MRRFLRWLYYTVFAASDDGRPFEVAVWSNALASVGVGALTFHTIHSWAPAIALGIVVFVLLRIALTHRVAIGLAAFAGILAVAGAGGGLAWLFAHLSERADVPTIAAALGAFTAAVVPAWAYAKLAARRWNGVPDALIEPVSIPPSRD